MVERLFDGGLACCWLMRGSLGIGDPITDPRVGVVSFTRSYWDAGTYGLGMICDQCSRRSTIVNYDDSVELTGKLLLL